MKCKYKESCGYEFCLEEDCTQYVAAPESNADCIRSMSDEELAGFLADVWATSARAWQKDSAETLRWLKQPAKEGE